MLLLKRYLLIAVVFVGVAVLWSLRRGSPAVETSQGPDQSQPPPGASVQTSTEPAAKRKAVRQVKAMPAKTPSSAISPAALLLGQATQAIHLSYDLLTKFTPDDVNYLNECYRSRTNLVDRAELTTVLGKIGNEQTVAHFIHCLTAEQAGKVFNEKDYPFGQDPESLLFNTTAALGVLASRHDAAFEFLKQGVRPEFWDATIQWKSEKGPESVGAMTTYTIDCLGSSGREEVRAILADLLKNPPTAWPPGNPRRRTFDGAVVSGAFWLDYVQEHGVETYKAGRGPTLESAYALWKASEKAKLWLPSKK